MKGKRILVTGGAGLIGSHITDQLLAEDPVEIVILDSFVRGRKGKPGDCARRRPGDDRQRRPARSRARHAGDRGHRHRVPSRGDPITQCAEELRLALEVLVDGTFNVLEAAVKAKVERVIASSSSSVYGMADRFPTAESHHPYNDRTIYGAAKAFNEGLLRSFNDMYDLKYVALRNFKIYGPRMDVFGAYTEVFFRWMERIAAGKAPIIFGDGLQTIDFVHVHDIALSETARRGPIGIFRRPGLAVQP
jgi:UDP-glucose 4-epimerase